MYKNKDTLTFITVHTSTIDSASHASPIGLPSSSWTPCSDVVKDLLSDDKDKDFEFVFEQPRGQGLSLTRRTTLG